MRRIALGVGLALIVLLGVVFYLLDLSLFRPYYITDVRWSSDGQRLIATYICTVEMSSWSTSDGNGPGRRSTRTVMGASKWAAIRWTEDVNAPYYVEMSPGEKYVVSYGRNLKLQLWDVETKAEIPIPSALVRNGTSRVLDSPYVVWNCTGDCMALPYMTGLRIWNVGSREYTEVQNTEVRTAAWSPSGKLLAYRKKEYENNIYLYNMEKKRDEDKVIKKIEMNRMLWNFDGTQLATWGHGSDVYVLDVMAGKAIKAQEDQGLMQRPHNIQEHAWSPDGRTLALIHLNDAEQSASAEEVCTPLLNLWDLAESRVLRSISLSPEPVKGQPEYTVVWSRDGRRIGTTCRNRSMDQRTTYTLQWWDAASGELLGEVSGEQSFPSIRIPFTADWNCMYSWMFTPQWSADLDKVAIASNYSLVKPPAARPYGCYSSIRIIPAPAHAMPSRSATPAPVPAK